MASATALPMLEAATVKRLLHAMAIRLGFDITLTRNKQWDIESHLRNVFAKYEIDCVIDVGANEGQYGSMLRRLGFTGHIVSFEPIKAVHDRLALATRGDSKWTSFNLALGDRAEKKTLNVYEGSVFTSFLTANAYSKDVWPSRGASSPQDVMVARLDEVFPEIVRRTNASRYCLKLDTQGYDLAVFRGAKGVLDRVRVLQAEIPMIQLYEGLPEPCSVIEEYTKEGFQISGLFPISREESLAVIEFDCVMIKKAP